VLASQDRRLVRLVRAEQHSGDANRKHFPVEGSLRGLLRTLGARHGEAELKLKH